MRIRRPFFFSTTISFGVKFTRPVNDAKRARHPSPLKTRLQYVLAAIGNEYNYRAIMTLNIIDVEKKKSKHT